MKRAIRWLAALLGVVVGVGVAEGVRRFFVETNLLNPADPTVYPYIALGVFALGILFFSVLFFFISEAVVGAVIRMLKWLEGRLQEVPMADMVFGCIGLVLGLVVAFLITFLFDRNTLPWLFIPLSILVYIIFGYLGATVFIKRWKELPSLGFLRKMRPHALGGGALPKVLDTSVIIDGRIFDICETGFVEGPLVVPEFVLKELRHIADSADALKRNRGRRGLDVLARIQRELDIDVQIDERDFEDVDEVDVKILKLAQLIQGCVVTNDYNLNKVAGVSGMKVLNINDLANAVKPVVLPGEEMAVSLVKEGKESGQGVAYLDDGTMIVVENGRKAIGETVEVVVTSVLQTSAGRMIFARLKNAA